MLYVHGASAAFNCKKDILTHTEYIKVFSTPFENQMLEPSCTSFLQHHPNSHQTSSRISPAQVFHRKSLRIIKLWGKKSNNPFFLLDKSPFKTFFEGCRTPTLLRTHFYAFCKLHPLRPLFHHEP